VEWVLLVLVFLLVLCLVVVEVLVLVLVLLLLVLVLGHEMVLRLGEGGESVLLVGLFVGRCSRGRQLELEVVLLLLVRVLVLMLMLVQLLVLAGELAAQTRAQPKPLALQLLCCCCGRPTLLLHHWLLATTCRAGRPRRLIGPALQQVGPRGRQGPLLLLLLTSGNQLQLLNPLQLLQLQTSGQRAPT